MVYIHFENWNRTHFMRQAMTALLPMYFLLSITHQVPQEISVRRRDIYESLQMRDFQPRRRHTERFSERKPEYQNHWKRRKTATRMIETIKQGVRGRNVLKKTKSNTTTSKRVEVQEIEIENKALRLDHFNKSATIQLVAAPVRKHFNVTPLSIAIGSYATEKQPTDSLIKRPRNGKSPVYSFKNGWFKSWEWFCAQCNLYCFLKWTRSSHNISSYSNHFRCMERYTWN